MAAQIRKHHDKLSFVPWGHGVPHNGANSKMNSHLEIPQIFYVAWRFLETLGVFRDANGLDTLLDGAGVGHQRHLVANNGSRHSTHKHVTNQTCV